MKMVLVSRSMGLWLNMFEILFYDGIDVVLVSRNVELIYVKFVFDWKWLLIVGRVVVMMVMFRVLRKIVRYKVSIIRVILFWEWLLMWLGLIGLLLFVICGCFLFKLFGEVVLMGLILFLLDFCFFVLGLFVVDGWVGVDMVG